jgi:hypothetical protein
LECAFFGVCHNRHMTDAATQASATAILILADIDAKEAADSRFAIKRRAVCEMLDVSMSRVISLEAKGELRSFLEGSERRITVASVYDRLRRLARLAHPASGAAPKGRPSPGQARKPKPVRPRTPQELEGLRKGNEGRAAEAQRKRVAKQTKQAEAVT